MLLAAPLTACTAMMASLGGAMPPALEANGVSAEAEVLEVWDTGWTVNDDPVIGMKVRVHPDSAPPYEATIEKTMVSRIGTWQFQPGTLIPVRYDPANPAIVAVDRNPRAAKASSGNPFRDGYQQATQIGVGTEKAPGEPAVYLGTGNNAADRQALYENNYSLLGASAVEGTGDLAQAVDYGRELGAALVVVYGRFEEPGDAPLDVLPYRRRPAPAGGRAASALESPMFTNLGPEGRVASYWRKTQPPILGVVFRPADEAERSRIGEGLVVEAVVEGSPAAAAGFEKGDLVVGIAGEPVGDVLTVPDRLRALAGTSVSFDVRRGGTALTLTAALNSRS